MENTVDNLPDKQNEEDEQLESVNGPNVQKQDQFQHEFFERKPQQLLQQVQQQQQQPPQPHELQFQYGNTTFPSLLDFPSDSFRPFKRQAFDFTEEQSLGSSMFGQLPQRQQRAGMIPNQFVQRGFPLPHGFPHHLAMPPPELPDHPILQQLKRKQPSGTFPEFYPVHNSMNINNFSAIPHTNPFEPIASPQPLPRPLVPVTPPQNLTKQQATQQQVLDSPKSEEVQQQQQDEQQQQDQNPSLQKELTGTDSPIIVKTEDVANKTRARSSRYRGVTKHRRSGRWEAHIWVKSIGRQVYLGGYNVEEHAAEAYDVAAIKCKGPKVKTNFNISKYKDLLEYMDNVSLDELVMAVRRQSQGFARGSSSFRGVTRHPNNSWEARIGIPGSKHIYLGLFSEEGEAAQAYDRSLVRLKGPAAATNFAISNYRQQQGEYHRMQSEVLTGPDVEKALGSGLEFERWIKHGYDKQSDQVVPNQNEVTQELLEAQPLQPNFQPQFKFFSDVCDNSINQGVNVIVLNNGHLSSQPAQNISFDQPSSQQLKSQTLEQVDESKGGFEPAQVERQTRHLQIPQPIIYDDNFQMNFDGIDNNIISSNNNIEANMQQLFAQPPLNQNDGFNLEIAHD
eukprot:TRINITY_DN8172_c0_g1_i2.p1 TRINITY_DN8172_c0_g1~~TRINITY_DN8172_c0_g1_i2.p1  ORF type:complete len:621 (-),score=81.37 TRINITY_DN8172_c0_g1_i2:249-2111(-)